MKKESRIMIIGKKALAVSAIVRNLKDKGFQNVEVSDDNCCIENEDTLHQIKDFKPQYVFFHAGYCPDDFTYHMDVLEAVRPSIEKFLFIADNDIYPYNLKNPIKEEALLSGPFRSGCRYAPSHIVGLKACESYTKRYGLNYLGCVSSVIYGIGDNYFHSGIGHIVSKIHEALKDNAPKVVFRLNPEEQEDYIFSEDFGEACVSILKDCNANDFKSGFINVGSGQLISNEVVASLAKKVIGYQGVITFENPFKGPANIYPLLDCQNLQNLGWTASWDFISGLKSYYENFFCSDKS